MTNREVLRLLQAERIASELSITRPISDPITELVVRWYEAVGAVHDLSTMKRRGIPLLDLASKLTTRTP